MPHFLSLAVHAAVILSEVIALVWLGQRALELATRTRFKQELMVKDNPAAGIVLAGYYLSLFIALSGLLSGEAIPLLDDLRITATHGMAAIFALLLSSYLWRPIVRVRLREDILTARNLGAGLLSASALIATGLIYRGAVHLQDANPAIILAFFALGEGALLVYLLVYEWLTPYDVAAEICEKGNVAAAISFSGATIAAGLILGNAVEGEFLGWRSSIRDAFLYMTPLLALPLTRWLVVNGLILGWGSVNREVAEDRNSAAGLVEAAAYVGIALFAVHLIG
ncbi:MAG TPA: DUF350 domain-containing protein [Planctomycetota bacterium]|nr:DUF350 domain-containing protein [Planctomycetota bacterium]